MRHGESAVFDVVNGVETGGVVDWADTLSAGKDGRGYEGTSPLGFARSLRFVDVDPAESTFVDLGCGKGRSLLLAMKAGFRKVIGVEISQQLLSVAERNTESLRRRGRGLSAEVELILGDVATVNFSATTPTVVYMYNPFGPETMQVVGRRIGELARRADQPIWVLYYIPQHHQQFMKASLLRCVHHDGRRAVYVG